MALTVQDKDYIRTQGIKFSVSLSSGEAKSINITNTNLDGYTLIGVCGITCNHGNVIPYGYYVNGGKIILSLYNRSTSTASVNDGYIFGLYRRK